MRILHIAGGGDIGGAKTHVISLLAALKARHSVVLVSLRSGPFSDDARDAGIPTVVIDSSNYLHILSRLSELVRQEQIQIVHCHGAKANLAGLLLRSRCHVPVVTTVHSDYRYDYMGSLLKRCTNGLLNTLAIHRLDYRIAVTEVFSELLIDRGFDPTRIFSVNNSLPFEDCDPILHRAGSAARRAYLEGLGLACDDDTVTVSIAARFHPVKDVSTLIRAFALAAAKNDRLRLLIGGCGVADLEVQEENRLRALVRELGLGDRAVFTGWVQDMDGFLSVSDISVLCSLSEGFPYSVLESVRRGAALCCTRVGAIPGIIDHGVNGLLIDPGDVKALADSMLRLADSRELRHAFARSLYEKCRRQYSMESMVSAHEDIYGTILRRRNAPTKRRYGVTVCGAYGFGNAGDDAILSSIVADMRSIDPDLPITVISKDPRQTRRTMRCASFYTFNFFKMLPALRRSALYINGGGTLMQDRTSTKSLLYYLATLQLSRLLGTPVMLYGSGIGPITKPLNRRISGRVLDRCSDIITLRDEASRRELESLRVTRPFCTLTGDPAISVCPPAPSRIHSLQLECGLEPDRPYCCIALRRWEGLDAQAQSALSLFTAQVYAQLGMQVLFLPMAHEADLAFMQSIMDNAGVPCAAPRRPLSVSDTVGLISASALVVGMRLHALVFAVSQKVPAVGICYDIKVSSFLEYAGKPYYLDLDQVEADMLLALSRAALQDDSEAECVKIRERAAKNRAYAAAVLKLGRVPDPGELSSI